jgi:hypothetical protein
VLFNSLTFVVFFAAVLAVHHLPLTWRVKKLNLLLASYLFYAAWNPPFVALLWLSTGTDWFINDHARVYVRMNRKDLSDRGRWLAGLRRGETFITNGAWLEFSVEKTGPGGEINLEKPQTVKLEGRAISRHNFGTLEVVQNGEIIHAVPALKRRDGPGFEAMIRDRAVRVAGSGWMALRIQPSPGTLTEMGRPLFGHTGPVYIRFGGNLHYDPEAADQLVRELDRSQDLIREKGAFNHPSELESILSIYQSAVSTILDKGAP